LLWDVMKFDHNAKISSKAVIIVTSFFTSDSFDTSCRDPFSMFQKHITMDSLTPAMAHTTIDFRVLVLLEPRKIMSNFFYPGKIYFP
jgi:hypothetical protein